MRKTPDPERQAIEPRLLSKTDAAAYCGLTPGGYDAWVFFAVPPVLPSRRQIGCLLFLYE